MLPLWNQALGGTPARHRWPAQGPLTATRQEWGRQPPCPASSPPGLFPAASNRLTSTEPDAFRKGLEQPTEAHTGVTVRSRGPHQGTVSRGESRSRAQGAAARPEKRRVD
jgi:hypothetical protein